MKEFIKKHRFGSMAVGAQWLSPPPGISDRYTDNSPGREMADLDVNQCALVARIRRVTALVGVANPAAGGVLAVFVVKTAFEYKDLLASPVRVRLELGVGRPLDERHVLGAVFVQRHHREPRYETG